MPCIWVTSLSYWAWRRWLPYIPAIGQPAGSFGSWRSRSTRPWQRKERSRSHDALVRRGSYEPCVPRRSLKYVEAGGVMTVMMTTMRKKERHRSWWRKQAVSQSWSTSFHPTGLKHTSKNTVQLLQFYLFHFATATLMVQWSCKQQHQGPAKVHCMLLPSALRPQNNQRVKQSVWFAAIILGDSYR